MSTSIEWTDETWNPVTGCTKVSPGCKFCYAERVTERFGRGKFTDVRLHPDRLDAPLRWRAPRRVFVNSMSDLFHEKVPDEFLDQVFAVMARSDGTKLPGRPRVHRLLAAHRFQVLTKRPERMHRYLSDPETPYRIASTVAKTYVGFYPARGGCDWAPWKPWPLLNLHFGVSVEDQARADERIPLLLQTPAAVRFLSVEPLLGPVDLRHHLRVLDPPFISWVIVGGESGGPSERALVTKGRTYSDRAPFFAWRPKDEALDWVRSLRDQCVAAGVPFFFKQFGGPTPKAGGRTLDGRTWDECPKGV